MGLRDEDARGVLKRAADTTIDLIFRDSERPEYPAWCPGVEAACHAEVSSKSTATRFAAYGPASTER